MVTAFGPQGPNYTTTRPPTSAVASGGVDTWAKDCSAPGASDGTIITASFFNVLVANVREAVRAGSIALNDSDDLMLKKAIQAIADARLESELSTVLDSLFGDDQGTLIYRGASAWAGLAPGAAGALLKCQGANANPVWALQQAATADYYVNGGTGDDANNGQSPATAFKTLTAAVNSIVGQFLSIGTVNLHIADNTYAGMSLLPSTVGVWNIVGNLSNIGNVVIQSNTGGVNGGRGIAVKNGVTAYISGVTIQSYLANLSVTYGAYVDVSSVAFTAPLYASSGTVSAIGGTVYLHGTITVTGAHSTFLSASQRGVLLMGYADAITTVALQITAIGSVSNSAQFVLCSDSASVVAIPAQVSFVGTFTGKRFTVNYNSLINVGGAGVNFFPGSVAGTQDNATGGYYV